MRKLIRNMGLWLLGSAVVGVIMGLLNQWHPTMGLGSVLYFVISGHIISWMWRKEKP